MNDLEKYAAKRKLAGRLGAGIGAAGMTRLIPIGAKPGMLGAAVGAKKGHRLRSALGSALGFNAATSVKGYAPVELASLASGLGAAIAHGGPKAAKAIDKAQQALKPIASGKNVKGLKRLSVKKNRITREKAQELSDTLEKIKASL